jgi:hypothetical protein
MRPIGPAEPIFHRSTLLAACEQDDLLLVQEILATHPTIDIQENRDELLRIACEHGHLDLAKYLHQRSRRPIEITYNDNELFQKVANRGHLPVGKWMRKTFAIDLMLIEDSPFTWSCANGQLPFAKWLWSRHAQDYDQHVRSEAFLLACRNDRLEVAEWLVIAYQESDLDDPFDPREDGDWVFRTTCGEDALSVLKWLIRYRPKILSKRKRDGFTLSERMSDAFGRAVNAGLVHVAKWLLRIYPALKIRRPDDYPFRFAVEQKHTEMIQFLITRVNAQDLPVKYLEVDSKHYIIGEHVSHLHHRVTKTIPVSCFDENCTQREVRAAVRLANAEQECC